MNKQDYAQQMGNWHKHKSFYVKSKSRTIVFSILIGALIIYSTLFFWNSGLLFFLLITPLLMRSFYLLAVGDWSDLAAQTGLKCQQCHTVFNSDKCIQYVFENNICPCCHKVVYDLT